LEVPDPTGFGSEDGFLDDVALLLLGFGQRSDEG
jgi:hypothetical protein